MGKLREEFSEDLKWNVRDLYKTEEDYTKDFKTLEQDIKKYETYQGHIMDSAKSLYEFLEFDTNFNKKLEQVYIYAHIQNDQDTTNTKYQTMHKKVYKLYEECGEKTSFVVPEILKSSEEQIIIYLKDCKELQKYERNLKDIIKMKKHILSDSEEKIIASLRGLAKIPDEVYSLLSDADLKFGYVKDEANNKIELNASTYHVLIQSTDRNVRKNAFKKLYKTYANFKNTYASLLAGEVASNNKMAKIRGYKSALEASLYGDDIPTEIYENLINTVKKNTQYQSAYWKLKKEILGVSSLHLYDTYAPTVKETSKKYTVEEAKELLFASLKVLGPQYTKDLEKAFREKWIDFCANEGKRSGAYCTCAYNVHPYVLLNFQGTLNDVSTLTHELGHAMHYYYAAQNQEFQDYSYSIFVAEVASQVNQILLSKYLIRNTNDLEEKKYLIDDLIQDFKGSIYRQTMFADFEYQIHKLESEGEILTHEKLSEIYYHLNKEYFGKNIVIDKEIEYEWARIPHFYMNFYVYQYATAYAAAIKIANGILKNEKDVVKNYLEFLKLGCSKTPIASLKLAGVDMTKEETLNEAFQYFSELEVELENLVRKC